MLCVGRFVELYKCVELSNRFVLERMVMCRRGIPHTGTYQPTKPDFLVLYWKFEVSTGILDLYEIYHILEIVGAAFVT